MRERTIEFFVGIFIILTALAMLVLAVEVSGFRVQSTTDGYNVVATFDNIGGLKVRAPVKVAGVRVGQVSAIHLDPKTYRAQVTLSFAKDQTNLSSDTTARILTSGLLGANYVELTPGFEADALKDGSQITSTNSAVILEDLIAQFIFKLK